MGPLCQPQDYKMLHKNNAGLAGSGIEGITPQQDEGHGMLSTGHGSLLGRDTVPRETPIYKQRTHPRRTKSSLTSPRGGGQLAGHGPGDLDLLWKGLHTLQVMRTPFRHFGTDLARTTRGGSAEWELIVSRED
jgi:hypothetical protein